MKLLHLLLGSAAIVSQTIAQTVVTPFHVQGFLDSATADCADFNCGGTVSVNGFPITIPKNLLVQFPAAFIPFKDVAAGSFVGSEVEISGNLVNGKPIAGLMHLSQLLLNAGSGFIESINGADGSMKITGGPTIRINDPNGVFGKAYTANPFFTADDHNPSVTAFSGFPMCIPRSEPDPLCPASNRPAGQQHFEAPDPLVMAPFAVGDYLEFSGIRLGAEIICYSIVAANIEITTSSAKGQPTYIRMEEAIIGVFDGSPNAEFADTRFIGYVSDPGASVTVNALDVDPCTGNETERPIGSASNRPNDARNKFIFRADSTTLSKYTREYKVKASTGQQPTKNTIIAGQYVQPVAEWIFPETLIPGINPPVNDFASFTHLVNGFVQEGKQFGQLNPWPGAAAPPSKTCTAPPPPPSPTAGATPIANAGPDVLIIPGTVIVLSGTQTNPEIDASLIDFSWTQASGDPVTLTNANGAKATFTSPAQSAATPIITHEFQLKVTLKSDPTATSTDNVIIKTDKSQKDTVVIDSYTWTSSQGGTLSVTAHSNVVLGGADSAKLQLFLGTAATGIAMTDNGGGLFSYSSRSTKRPVSITVKSIYGGSDGRTATTAKRRKRRSPPEEFPAFG